jgi:hypothetical protein
MGSYGRLRKAYWKTVSAGDGCNEAVTADSYLIYLLHKLAATLRNSQLSVALSSGTDRYCFHIGTAPEQLQHLTDFLKIYALLQLESHPWLIKLNHQLLRRYKAVERRGQEGLKLMLVDLDAAQNSPNLPDYYIVLRWNGTPGSNIFSLSPTAPNPLLLRIGELAAAGDQAVLFFKREGESAVLRKKLGR